MRGQNATTAVLVAVAVAVGVYAFVVDRADVPEKERVARAQNLLPIYRREEVTRLELAPTGDKAATLVIERELAADASSSPFRMGAPVAGDVDPAAVDALLAALEHASPLRVVAAADGRAPSELGFDAPRVRGTLTMTRVTYRFALGADAPTPPGAAYLRVDGVGTFVVARELVAALTRPADAYRDRAFVAFDPAAVRAVEITRAGAVARHLVRLDALSFRTDDDGRARAPRDPVDRALTALSQLRAETFVDAPPSPAASNATRVRLTFAPDAPPMELAVGGACGALSSGTPGVLVTRASPFVAACVATAITEPLDALFAPAAIADTALFAAHDDEVEEIHLEGRAPEHAVDLARRGAGFHERAPVDRELTGADAEVAHALVAAVVAAHGDVVARPPAPPKSAVVARVRIVRASGLGDEEVALDADGIVTRGADGVALRVSPDVARALTPSALTLRKARVFDADADADPGAVQSLTARCNGVAQAIVRDAHGDLVYAAPAGYAVDVARVLDVARTVFRASAERWVAATDDGRFGFAESSCSIDVALTGDDGGVTHAPLVFGARAAGAEHDGVYARNGAGGPVFVASAALQDAAATLFVDRHGFHVDPRSIARIVLARGRRRVDLAPTTSASVDAGAAFEAVAQVFDGLRAESVRSLGEPNASDGFASPSLDVTLDLLAPATPSRRHIVFGATVVVAGRRMVCARMDGVRATFLLARESVEPLFAALEPLPVAKE